MRFSEMTHQRPDYEAAFERLDGFRLASAQNAGEQLEIYRTYEELCSHLSTQITPLLHPQQHRHPGHLL